MTLLQGVLLTFAMAINDTQKQLTDYCTQIGTDVDRQKCNEVAQIDNAFLPMNICKTTPESEAMDPCFEKHLVRGSPQRVMFCMQAECTLRNRAQVPTNEFVTMSCQVDCFSRIEDTNNTELEECRQSCLTGSFKDKLKLWKRTLAEIKLHPNGYSTATA